MGSSPDFPDISSPPADLPGERDSKEPGGSQEPGYVTPLVRRTGDSVRRHVVLFLMTVVTTTLAGSGFYASFATEFSDRPMTLSQVDLLLHGLWYTAPVLAILSAHEFGHYFACRYYRIDASLPYFLPMPPQIGLFGTLGAFIRIRQLIPTKRQLFDIGIAGPIAGFLLALPTLLLGMSMSRVVPVPTDYTGLVVEFGEPLVFRGVVWLVFGTLPEGQTIDMHPIVVAGWFGLLATALNLFPMGQLDGGHISYAVFGRKSTVLTIGTLACLIGLAFLSYSWILWALLTTLMLFLFGPGHPRTLDEDVPLDHGRTWLAAFALLMFILCFTPAPLELHDLVRSGTP